MTPIPILTGPTATGKSRLALKLAERFGLEIINADATLFYRGLDIGTAKPTREERERIPHHLIDVLDPDQAVSVVWFVQAAERAIEAVLRRGRIPLVVGGSGYYIRALSHGFYRVPPPDPELTRALEVELAEKGFARLHQELARVSPQDAMRVKGNPRRLLRALFVLRKTGRPPAELPWASPRFAYRKLILWPERERLLPVIQARALAQFEAGLVEEVRGLLARYPHMPTAIQTIGYKEVVRYLRGEMSLEAAIEEDWRAVWRYAKRQYTWFRREPGDVVYLPRMGDEAWDGLLAWWIEGWAGAKARDGA